MNPHSLENTAVCGCATWKKTSLHCYQALLQGNFLNAHLNEIDRQAHEMVEQTVQQLIRSEQFDESVKLSNPFLLVQKMNSFKNIAEETVMRDLIYC